MQQHLSQASSPHVRFLGGLSLLIVALILGLVVGFTQAAAYPGPWAQKDDCSPGLGLSAEPPPAPSDLTCIPISETEIALCWRDNSCTETEFRVERSENGGPWHEVATVPKNTSTYRNSGLTPGTTYRYRVRGYRQSNDQYSAYTNETTCVTALAGRVEPPDRACENPPTFEWTPVSGAITYTLQVGTTPTFDPPLNVAVEVTGTSYTPAGSLPLGTYYWRVGARDECAESAWSRTWSVTLITRPDPPEPISPPDGQTTCNAQPSFCWSEVPNATSYSLIIDDDPDLRSPVVNVTDLTGTCFALTDPLPPGRYYWSADAANECARAWLPPRVLIVQGPPGAPELVSPPDAYQTCEAPPTFSWTPSAGANFCCFQLDDDPDFSSPIITDCLVSSPYTLAVSLDPGTYYWRVGCHNDCGSGDWSPARSFTLLQPLSPPTLQQPDDGLQICDNTPTFSWSPVQGASCYSFQLADNPDFSTLLINETCLPTSTYTVNTPLAPGTYYWRADASNECGRSWSQSRSIVILGPPLAPQLTDPPDAGGVCAPQPIFSWTPPAGADSCCFQLDDDLDFSSPIVTECQVSPPYVITVSLDPGTYYWRVRCDNDCGPGPWSPPRTVTIQDYESACQYLVSNGDFETGESWITSQACAPRYSTDKARSGSRSILIGIPPSDPDTQCTSAIWQPLTIPADTTSAILSFWYWPWSEDTIAYDWQELQVRDADFNVLETLMRVNETNSEGDPWRKRAFDLTRYAGQTIYIYFAVHNDGVGDQRTFMYVDDVSLVACQTRLCLAPSTIAGQATLQGRTEHGGVEVSVDGTACDLTDEQGGFQCSVTPGTHVVSVSRCQYLTAQQTVTVTSGITLDLPDVVLPGGDVNNDCRVNIFDLTIVGGAYDTCPGDGTCTSTDANGDGCVDIRDLVIVGGNYGLECPRPWSSTLALGMAVMEPTAPIKVRLTRSVGDGNSTRFQVWLEGASQLYAADLRLRFDPTVTRVVDKDRDLDGVQIQPGPWLRDAGTFVVRADADNAAGALRLAFTRLAPAPPLHGDVLLASVDLTGAGELRLTGLELLDPEGRALEWTPPEGERLPFQLHLPLVLKPGE